MVDQLHLFIQLADEFIGIDIANMTFNLTHPGGELPFNFGTELLGDMPHKLIDDIDSTSGEWTLTLTDAGNLADGSNQLNPNAIKDIRLILHYRIEE